MGAFKFSCSTESSKQNCFLKVSPIPEHSPSIAFFFQSYSYFQEIALQNWAAFQNWCGNHEGYSVHVNDGPLEEHVFADLLPQQWGRCIFRYFSLLPTLSLWRATLLCSLHLTLAASIPTQGCTKTMCSIVEYISSSEL